MRDYGTAQWDGGDPACDHVDPLGPVNAPSAKSTLTTNNGKGPQPGDKYHHSRTAQYRSTCGKCGAVRVDNQIGLEESPEAYVAALVEVFRAVRRVLRDDGVVFLNLGDSYFGGGGYSPESPSNVKGSKQSTNAGSIKGTIKPMSGLKSKDLIGIPWRVALALQADGWWLRSDIVWSKPNCMPESVTDRPTRSHEYLFLLTKQPTYYYDAMAIAEKSSAVDAYAISELQYEHGNQTMLDLFTDTPAVGLQQTEGRPEPWRNLQGVREAQVTRVAANTGGQSICTACGGEIQQQQPRESQADSIQSLGQTPGSYQNLRSIGEGQAGSSTLSADREAQSGTSTLLQQNRQSNDPALSGHSEGQGKPIAWSSQAPGGIGDTEHVDGGRMGGNQGSPRVCVCLLRPDGSATNAGSHHSSFEGRATHQGEHRAGLPELQQSQGQPLRNRRSVWSIPTQPNKQAHFATMPDRLAELAVLAGSSPQACEVCGAPWRRVTETLRDGIGTVADTLMPKANGGNQNSASLHRDGGGVYSKRATLGWQPSCACPDATGSGKSIVLDPFFGSGTVGRVALKHGRACIGIDLNPDYLSIAERRTDGVQVSMESLL